MLTVNSVSLSDARRIIEAGEAKAVEFGRPSNIAVVARLRKEELMRIMR